MSGPLFAPEATPPAAEPAKTPDPATPDPKPDPAVAALQEQVSGIASSVDTLTQGLQQALNAPAPEPPPAKVEPTNTDDYLTQLANNPQDTIRREAIAAAQVVAQQTYGGTANQLVETQHVGLMNQYQTQIDGIFGKDTWTEVFVPKMQSDLQGLRQANLAAIAHPDTIKILVDRIVGQEREALNERETKFKTGQQEEWVATRTEIAASLPASGMTRRVSADGTPDPETKLFLSEVAEKTGQKIDPARFLRIMNAGNTLEDWQEAQKEQKAS